MYLISHNRRFLEILNPSLLDITPIFKTDFRGMTVEPVEMVVLEQTRSELIRNLNLSLTMTDKEFLIGFKEGNPDWSHFRIKHVRDLPAVKWKQHNLNKLNESYRQGMVDELRKFFEM